jgi:hypothetical protein
VKASHLVKVQRYDGRAYNPQILYRAVGHLPATPTARLAGELRLIEGMTPLVRMQ